MTWIISFFVAACAAGLVATTRTRTAQLASIAKANGYTFDKRKESITTQQTAGRLEFFTLFFHQYRNVFTFSDSLAFIRLADDTIFTDDKPGTKPLPVTVLTAELKKKQFPQFKAAPLASPFAPSQQALMKTNITEIDNRYRIHATSPVAGLLFTPFMINLFKTRDNIYLELNENALVYHEHTLVPLEEMEKFRFRAIQLLGELEEFLEQMEQNDPMDTATTFITANKEFDEERASSLLQHFSNRSIKYDGKNSWRGFWFLILLLIFVGITLLSWFVLRFGLGR